MSTWNDFELSAPQIAPFVQERLAGRVAYLATIRPNGGPRVHPVTPIIGGGHLFIFMEPSSPKGRDLQRDGRYALHCGVEDTSGGAGEVILQGRAALITDPNLRALAVSSASYQPAERYILFELFPDQVSTTIYQADGIVRERWQSSEVS